MKNLINWIKNNKISSVLILISILWGIDVIVNLSINDNCKISFIMLYVCYIMQTIIVVELIEKFK